MNEPRLISECCGAPALTELDMLASPPTGFCSQCKDGTGFIEDPEDVETLNELAQSKEITGMYEDELGAGKL